MRRSRIAAIATVLKTVTPHGVRGFESHLLRKYRRRAHDGVLFVFATGRMDSNPGRSLEGEVLLVKEYFKTEGFENRGAIGF